MRTSRLLPGLIPLVILNLSCFPTNERSQTRPSAVNGGPEDPAVLAVENLGGICFRARQLRELGNKDPWLSEVEGDPVVVVDYRHHSVTNSDLKKLTLLKQLRELDLSDAKVTDAGLKELSSFRHLQVLHLQSTSVTDKCLKELVPLKQLHSLDLSKKSVKSGVYCARKFFAAGGTDPLSDECDGCMPRENNCPSSAEEPKPLPDEGDKYWTDSISHSPDTPRIGPSSNVGDGCGFKALIFSHKPSNTDPYGYQRDR